MVQLAVIGSNEFIVGFQLAGIRNVMEASDRPFNDLKSFRSSKEIGVVVVEEKIIESLEQHEKQAIEASVDPVYIPVSAKAEQESLKKLIKKSIGVDLWK
jgi:V/A-type H+-transporting ATPase subunit F